MTLRVKALDDHFLHEASTVLGREQKERNSFSQRTLRHVGTRTQSSSNDHHRRWHQDSRLTNQRKPTGPRIGIEAPQDIRVLRGELKPFGLSAEGDEVESSENEQDTAKRGAIPGRGLVTSIWPNKARAVSA